jgi:decaprenyl-phosphate phosphoribosyltransferase
MPIDMRTSLLPVLASLRPRQWTKNLILFAGAIFARQLADPACASRAAAAFAVFCLASGTVYIVNDIADVVQDRLHPDKSRRPIASGRLPIQAARRAAVVLGAIAVVAAALLGWPFLLAMLAFIGWNAAYTRVLKRIAIADVVGIGVSFVLRATAGWAVLLPVVPGVELSFWLLLCPFFLSLFLGFGKRRHELLSLAASSHTTRPVLTMYNETMLNVLIGTSFGLTLAAYALYTIWPTTVEHFGTRHLIWTTSFVFAGLWRYMYLVFRQGRGGRPHEILLNDPLLQVLVIGWISASVAIIGIKEA